MTSLHGGNLSQNRSCMTHIVKGSHGLPVTTGVDRGAKGAQAPQWPGKKNFFVKIEGLSS